MGKATGGALAWWSLALPYGNSGQVLPLCSTAAVCSSVVVLLPIMSLQLHSLTPKASARWSGVGLILPGHPGAGMRTPVWKPALWSRWNQLGDLAPTVGAQVPAWWPVSHHFSALLPLFTCSFPPNSAPPLLGAASGLSEVTSPAPPLLQADYEALSPGCVSVC